MEMIDTYEPSVKYLPPKDELWGIVGKAYTHLYSYLHGGSPSYNGKPIWFKGNTWWGKYDAHCEACLAGLWHIQEYGVPIPSPIPEPMYSIVCFIDALRWADLEVCTVRECLGVEVPYELRYTLHKEYSARDPEHILLFLEWLLWQDQVGLHYLQATHSLCYI